jgi:hypothetical protein
MLRASVGSHFGRIETQPEAIGSISKDRLRWFFGLVLSGRTEKSGDYLICALYEITFSDRPSIALHP